MAKMKIIFLSSWCSSTASYKKDDEESFDIDVAARFVDAGTCKAKTNKEHDILMEHLQSSVKEEADKQAQLNALLHKETIELELNGLYLAVVEKEAELSGVTLDEEQTRTLVEELKKGRDSVSQDNNSANG